MERTGKLAFSPHLKPGQVINNEELCRIFGCGPQGGMRRSLKTNSLVIVSNHIESIYEDRWDGDVLHYTGMGQKDNQSIDFMQNRTLAENPGNGIGVFLFEVFDHQQYTYQGQVYRCQLPYEEKQPDVDGKLRTVWVFPVRFVDEEAAGAITAESYFKKQELREKKAKKLPDRELQERAQLSPPKAGTRNVLTKQYDRNEYVAEFARRRAGGVCQLCHAPAPFNNRQGDPYLEIHHITWLARGGADTISNTVALCPNCHKKMHILDLERDRQYLQQQAAQG